MFWSLKKKNIYARVKGKMGNLVKEKKEGHRAMGPSSGDPEGAHWEKKGEEFFVSISRVYPKTEVEID